MMAPRPPLHRLLGLLVLAASLGGGWLLWDYRVALDRPLAVPPAGLTLEVAPGESLRSLARRLAADGVLHRPLYLVAHARLEGVATRIQAGEYQIPAGETPRTLLARLVAGRVVQHRLTLVEGWTFAQVRAALEAEPALRQTLRGLPDAEVMARLGRPGEHPEGRFFPDTYQFPRGGTDLDLLRRAYEAMARHLAREWAGRAPGLPLETPYQALILASIVEKETGVAAERPLIAGVFIRRLQRGMRLQSDPTVIYGLGAAFDGNLRRADLRRDTPYNTYTRAGLPPTPIAMPGLDAIRAVLHPAPGDALYFVARGDGTHVFSATLAEHRRAVARYQRGGR
ncbi:endolytic transglycosylase MltG [Inmirania thermothiophila]|uniref:Endolytic murein transglycosylase n=1 Tax=Inmirania thermothiophila TaxID=1750597 RepID=A0A3N1Y1D1_9GAMM|nr:endolytic transglycosylase MltG [Inmirania thermothiophila]ROR32629.1 UPF0755 protein [Inmirania thermothiophila]